MNTEVVVVMPVKHAWATLGMALDSLREGCRDVAVELLLCNNGSTDPGYDLVHSPRLAETLGFPVRALTDVPSKDAHVEGQALQNANLAHLIHKFTDWVYYQMRPVPPFMFRLDADVAMAPWSLKAVLEVARREPKIGMFGILYPPETDHVRGGCTLFRMKAMAEIMQDGGFGDEGCTCRWLHHEMERRGWTVRLFTRSAFLARHLGKEPQ